jgi:hypothetical protein
MVEPARMAPIVYSSMCGEDAGCYSVLPKQSFNTTLRLRSAAIEKDGV